MVQFGVTEMLGESEGRFIDNISYSFTQQQWFSDSLERRDASQEFSF